jgi:hypothetical protein
VTSLRWFGGTCKDPGDPKNHFAQFAIEPQKPFAAQPQGLVSSMADVMAIPTGFAAYDGLAGAGHSQQGIMGLLSRLAHFSMG